MNYIFDRNKNLYTASYIFTIERYSGQVYYGFVRKVFRNGRKGNKGAAGTNPKYYGKWTSIGGSQKGNHILLHAAIKELNDEANINPPLNHRNVILNNQNINMNNPLKCHNVYKNNNTIIFIFEMEENMFFQIFPKNGYTSPSYIYSSYGEIDAACSFNTNDILYYQNFELNNYNNNYYTSYCIESFNNYIIPFMTNYYNFYNKRWFNCKIPYCNDIIDRYVHELYHYPY